MTELKTSTGPEDHALSALNAITRDDPEAAREHIRALSFRDRALITAWAGELSRLVQDEQDNYEISERRAARDRHAAEDRAATSRKVLRTRISLMFEESGADAPAVRVTDFADLRQSRPWIVGELKQLTDEGVLEPVPDYPGRYVVLKAPDGDSV
ncbi:hypothetical protein [Streptomyces africanus]|uniref:hypothetical protein n=1 Tax=Streptomyces africanus TaxID=231024 RepID=UPI000A3B45EF|nr:hypothetical protein [Streptomyces africanus]